MYSRPFCRPFQLLKAISVVVVTLLFMQCSQEDMEDFTPQPEGPSALQLQAQFTHLEPTSEGRTVTSPEGKVSWEATDKLKVFIVKTATQQWENHEYRFTTNADDCISNRFTAQDKHVQLSTDEDYDWYVMSPYQAAIKEPLGHDNYCSFDGQKQSANNSTRHLTDYDIMTGTALSINGKAMPKLTLKHKAVLMTFRLRNESNQTISLKRIEFEAEKGVNIGGTYAIDFREEGQLLPRNTSNIISLELNPCTLHTGDEYVAHILMPPFEIAKGKTFSVRAITDKGIGEQTTVARHKSLTFAAGTINKTNISFTHFEKSEAVFAKGVSHTSGWYDVNKKGDGTTLHGDALMCWAASSANMIAWWQDRYSETYGNLPSGAVSGTGDEYELALFELYQQHWKNNYGSEVYFGIPWYFSGENRGGTMVNSAQPYAGTGGYWQAEWPAIEAVMGHDYVPYVQYYAGWGPWRPDTSIDAWDVMTRYIVEGIRDGVMSISINAGFSAIHAITLWGYELNEDGRVGKVYVTDSDDLLKTPSAPRVQILNDYNVGRNSKDRDEIGLLNCYKPFCAISQLTTLKRYEKK